MERCLTQHAVSMKAVSMKAVSIYLLEPETNFIIVFAAEIIDRQLPEKISRTLFAKIGRFGIWKAAVRIGSD